MTAIFVHDGFSIDYTPTANVAAGEIVALGNLVGIAQVDIPANTLGALAVFGVFDVRKGASAFAGGDAVYYDSSTKKATTEGDIYLGRAVQAASATESVVRVRLEQRGTAAAAASGGTGLVMQSYIASLTNNTGGIESNTLAAPGAAYSSAELANALASLSRKMNEIINALRGAGVISNVAS